MANECLVRTLSMSTGNENLPIFKKVVVKNYVKTSSDDQYIRIPSLSYPRNAVKVDIVFKYLSSTAGCIVCTSNQEHIDVNSSYVEPWLAASRVDYFGVTLGNDISAGYDTSDSKVYVNQTQDTGATISSTSVVTELTVFGRIVSSNVDNIIPAGKVAIKSIKITIGTTEHDIVPALVNDVPCLYNNTTGETYLPNIGTLIVE